MQMNLNKVCNMIQPGPVQECVSIGGAVKLALAFDRSQNLVMAQLNSLCIARPAGCQHEDCGVASFDA